MKFTFQFQYTFTHVENPFNKEFEAETFQDAYEQAKEFALLKMLDLLPYGEQPNLI